MHGLSQTICADDRAIRYRSDQVHECMLMARARCPIDQGLSSAGQHNVDVPASHKLEKSLRTVLIEISIVSGAHMGN